MSIFQNILNKLGFKKPEAKVEAKPAVSPALGKATGSVMPGGAPMAGRPMPPRMAEAAPEPVAAKPVEMPMVDVVSKLDGLAKASPIELNWKESINDLMALLGLDHKPDDIKALAVELGCPESEIGDSYKRNVWTHKALLKKIAENGGNVPASLLD